MESDVQEIYWGNTVKDEREGAGERGESLQITVQA